MTDPTRSDELSTFLSGPSRLKIVIVDSEPAGVSLALAKLEVLLATKPAPTIGLATGGTFHSFFDETVARERAKKLTLKNAHFTHLDEFVGWSGTDAGGMVAELSQRLFARLEQAPRGFYAIEGTIPPSEAIQRHDENLQSLGPLDLQFLGVGRNGHVGFNEPGTPFSHRTHEAELHPNTLSTNSHRYQERTPPKTAITAGPATILSAKALCMLAFGAEKAEAVRALLEDPISTRCPASLLRLHPDATLILDTKAAGRLGSSARFQPKPWRFEILGAKDLRPEGPVVILSPHPDDASISCGGLLASLPPATERYILTLTTGARARIPGVSDRTQAMYVREAEVREEARILGAGAHFLRARFYDSGAFEESDAIRLAEDLEGLDPKWIVAPSLSDPHPTHRLSRQIADAAILRLVSRTKRPVEVWTFEGPWFQHRREEVNTLIEFDARAEERKMQAVRAHQSQLARVPFDEGAMALARLRGIGYAETHFGGTEPGKIFRPPLVEAYVREEYVPLNEPEVP